MRRTVVWIAGAAAALVPMLAPSAEADRYVSVPVKSGGTIVGFVQWEGPVPRLEPFPINKDTEFCDADKSGKKRSPRLSIGPKGGVANTVVHLSGITKGKGLPQHGERNPLKLDQEACEYRPHVLIAPVKSYLAMGTRDTIIHNIHMFGAASYNIPFPEKGKVIVKRLRKEGVITLRCDAGHGWMSAIIFVVDHPYYAVTDAEGNFALEHVPPGKYTLRAWHEGWNVVKTIKKNGKPAFYEFDEPTVLSQDVTVPAGKTVRVKFSLGGK